MKKTLITEEQEKEIVDLYLSTINGTESLALKFKVGKKRINDIFKKYNTSKKKKGNQITIDIKKIKEDYKEARNNTNNNFIAKCKKTNRIFNDYNNKSGSLTTYLRKIYPEINIPSNYDKKVFLKRNGFQWHEQYFDISKVNKKETRKCMYCNWETTDIENKTGCFENHLKDIHNKTLKEFIKQFPEEIKYHLNFKRIGEREKKLENEENYIICKLCNKKFKTITNTHLKNHGIDVNKYKKLFPDSRLVSNEKYEQFKEQYRKANINMKPIWVSEPEKEIIEFIKNLNINYETRNRKLLSGGEIDIVIPSKKIGIEFNGNKWHTQSFGNKGMNYHLNKTKILNKQGWKLIHIFEDEWYLKQEIVKNRISYILGLSNSFKIGARKCEIKEISKKEKSKFLKLYHIQGNDNSQIYIGAYYNEILVGVMTFKSSRNMTKSNESFDCELSRYSTNYNYIISGLASKMLKFHINKYNPNIIISFADRRWTLDVNENLYTKLGFEFQGFVKPNYWYYNSKIDRYKRFHKFGFGKSSLKRKGMYIDGMTEWECMQHHGYDRIWDCGLIKYKLNIN